MASTMLTILTHVMHQTTLVFLTGHSEKFTWFAHGHPSSPLQTSRGLQNPYGFWTTG